MARNFNKSVLATALASAMGLGAAHADIINFDYDGWLTMLNSAGQLMVNHDTDSSLWRGWRTPITGTLTIDTYAGTGTGGMDAFSFFGSGLAAAKHLDLQAIDVVPEIDGSLDLD